MNDRLNLTCKADGNPPPTITWTRNDNLDNVGRGAELRLSAVQSWPGNYTCRVSNGIGSVKTATSLVIVKGNMIRHLKIIHDSKY